MRNKKPVVALVTLVVVSALIALRVDLPGGTLPKVHAQEEAQEGCSLQTLQGGYGLTFQGFATSSPVVPAPIAAFVPAAGSGLVTFDGNGGLSISETVSLGGQILPLNLSGTYTVNSDCTGSQTSGSGISATHLNLVIVRNGKEILAINTNPGRVVVNHFIKQ